MLQPVLNTLPCQKKPNRHHNKLLKAHLSSFGAIFCKLIITFRLINALSLSILPKMTTEVFPHTGQSKVPVVGSGNARASESKPI